MLSFPTALFFITFYLFWTDLKTLSINVLFFIYRYFRFKILFFSKLRDKFFKSQIYFDIGFFDIK